MQNGISTRSNKWLENGLKITNILLVYKANHFYTFAPHRVRVNEMKQNFIKMARVPNRIPSRILLLQLPVPPLASTCHFVHQDTTIGDVIALETDRRTLGLT